MERSEAIDPFLSFFFLGDFFLFTEKKKSQKKVITPMPPG